MSLASTDSSGGNGACRHYISSSQAAAALGKVAAADAHAGASLSSIAAKKLCGTVGYPWRGASIIRRIKSHVGRPRTPTATRSGRLDGRAHVAAANASARGRRRLVGETAGMGSGTFWQSKATCRLPRGAVGARGRPPPFPTPNALDMEMLALLGLDPENPLRGTRCLPACLPAGPWRRPALLFRLVDSAAPLPGSGLGLGWAPMHCSVFRRRNGTGTRDVTVALASPRLASPSPVSCLRDGIRPGQTQEKAAEEREPRRSSDTVSLLLLLFGSAPPPSSSRNYSGRAKASSVHFAAPKANPNKPFARPCITISNGQWHVRLVSTQKVKIICRSFVENQNHS